MKINQAVTSEYANLFVPNERSGPMLGERNYLARQYAIDMHFLAELGNAFVAYTYYWLMKDDIISDGVAWTYGADLL